MSRPYTLKLASYNVLLLCQNDHEHLCGDGQAERILRDPRGCPWCHTPLREVQRWHPDDDRVLEPRS